MFQRNRVISTWAGLLVLTAGLFAGCGAQGGVPGIQGPRDPVSDGSQPDGSEPAADAASAKTYVGQVANTLALIGLVAEGERVIAYVCDGDPGAQSLSQWYEGWLAPNGSFNLDPSAAYLSGDAAYAGGSLLSGKIENSGAGGWMYDRAGRVLDWAAEPADGSGPAGLYVGDDGDVVTSVVVLNAQFAQGLTRVRASGVQTSATSPEQISTDGTFAVRSGDTELQVERVSGSIELRDSGIVGTSPRQPPPSDTRAPTLEEPGRIPAPENAIQIKFRDGLTIRLPRGAREPVDLNRRALVSREAQELLAEVSAGTWSRSHVVDERTLDALRASGERRIRKPLPDLNLYFNLQLPRELSAEEYVQRFRRLSEVEWAWIMPDFFLAVAPDYAQSQGVNPANNKMLPYQRYLDAAPVGVDARYAWLWNADATHRGDGRGVKVVDIETAFNPSHVDLPDVTLPLELTAGHEPRSVNHGTATLGVIAGLDNQSGVKGIAHGADIHFISGPYGVFLTLGLDGFIVASFSGTFGPGDVIVLEQQMGGPNFAGDPNNQFGMVAVEWYKPVFDAIRIATANGIIVVEAAGNGSQNLDGNQYLNDVDAYHQPFRVNGTERVNDSGAILVGAGASGADWSLYGTLTPRTKHAYSNYGGRVDLQAWGDAVVTAGIATWAPENIIYQDGPNDVYHHHYSGTSSATAIMGGTVAALQGFYKFWTGGTPLTGPSMRSILAATGTPQAGNTTQKIGPLPNLKAAIDLISLNTEPGVPQDEELVQIGCALPPLTYDVSCTGTTPLPNPSWSLPSGVYTSEALEFIRPIWPDPRPASSLIHFTLDGSNPVFPENCASPCTMNSWGPVLTDPHCASMADFGATLTQPLICKARLHNNAGFCPQPGVVSQTATEVYVPPGYIKLPKFDRPSTYNSTLRIRMRTDYPNTYPDGFAFVSYTLDGSEPVYYSNSADGISSPIWTNYLDDLGYTIPIFSDDVQPVVTLRARNYLFIANKAVPGEIVQWTYPRLD